MEEMTFSARGVILMMYKKLLKRIIDFILALIGLIVLSPVFLILIIAIKSDSKGPILFKQKRMGAGKKHFQILKFRTMYVDTPKDVPTHLLTNAEAFITKTGSFLRKTSLDELPQLINILMGNMAVIGPRPALWNQEDLINLRDECGANDIRPGLTGYAQVNGRDELEIETKAFLDGEYAKKMSLAFDISIFFKTIFNVLGRKGIVDNPVEDNQVKELINS